MSRKVGDPEAPECQNGPRHLVVWSHGFRPRAELDEWYCLDCAQPVEGEPPKRARKAQP